MLDEKKALGQSLQNRKQPLDAVDDQRARQAAEDLIVDKTVGVRVVPEQPRALAAGSGNVHFVLERFAGMNVDEDIVAVAPRRHAHAVKVQV